MQLHGRHPKADPANPLRQGGVWRALLGPLLILSLGGRTTFATPPPDETPGSLEAQVKAAFLVKFAAFIQWPDSVASATNTPFRIGILGRDPFGSDFDAAVAKETLNQRPIQIERARQAADLKDCQIVFVADAEAEPLRSVLGELGDRPVLLVTDEPGAAARGSHINFFKLEGRVRFEFNLAAFERSGLRLGGRLRQVGRVAVDATNAPPAAAVSPPDIP